MITNSVINDYDWFERQWKKVSYVNLENSLQQYNRRLRDELGFFVPELDQLTSQWFKQVYVHPQRKGMMI